jgi:hypothetical protein
LLKGFIASLALPFTPFLKATNFTIFIIKFSFLYRLYLSPSRVLWVKTHAMAWSCDLRWLRLAPM